MNRIVYASAFAVGLAVVVWVGVGFVGVSWLALLMTGLIAAGYLLGAVEIQRFRAATASLAAALNDIPQPLADIGPWLERVPPSLRHPVRLRIEGERTPLPGPALTPYLVGLLVMLGMLGTFLGMVLTFKGAVFALEGSADLQAIRSALAEPIKGLGLSFGTSVAGVAASAMLGLISALSRRDRVDVARLLDTQAATIFRPLSLTHQRQEAFKALQAHAQALPDIVGRLSEMMDGLERRSEQLNAQLLGQQAQFHREASTAYASLAESVGRSLQDSLTASATAAGQSIKPVVEMAMTEIAQESQRTHQRLVEATQSQLEGLSSRWETTAREVSGTWVSALASHTRTSDALVSGLDQALSTFTHTFDQRASALLLAVQDAAARAQAEQVAAEGQRLQAWTQRLDATATALLGEWQRVGAQTFDQQQAVCRSLETSAGAITERAGQQVAHALGEMTRLLAQAEGLIRSRIDAETQWIAQQGERMDQLAGVWRTELATLRDDEARRGQAAVAQLEALQGAVAGHLATLGQALEAPLTRLLQTASEVPQAAAEVIGQLRQEMTHLAERDNAALEERQVVMGQISTLLQTINRAAGEQQAVIESLTDSARAVLDKAGSAFAQSLEGQVAQVADSVAHVTASAVELASLGESFGHGVSLFNATNEKLMDSLQRIEGALAQSLARSDEQLAYYVAQARELIDLSISSQQGIVEDLRRLHGAQAAGGGAR